MERKRQEPAGKSQKIFAVRTWQPDVQLDNYSIFIGAPGGRALPLFKSRAPIWVGGEEGFGADDARAFGLKTGA